MLEFFIRVRKFQKFSITSRNHRNCRLRSAKTIYDSWKSLFAIQW